MKVDVWVLIAAGVVATLGPKAVGPLLLGGRTLPAPLQRALVVLPPALVAALIVVAIWGTDGAGGVERGAGVVAGTLVVLRRGPLLLAMVVAAAVAAGLRLIA